MTDPNPWETFAREDPYFYIATDFELVRGRPDAVDHFYDSGKAIAEGLLSKVAGLLTGRSMVIEIGCGVGRLLLGHAGQFETFRGVDVAPTMLSMLEARAAEQGIDGVHGFLTTAAWDEPTESADYVYSGLVFQHIEDASEIAAFISRIGGVLRHGGIAQLQFDTRPQGFRYQARRFVPDRCLGRTQRRGIRRVRRDPAWIRQRIGEAGLAIVSEREPGTTGHWFVLRRP